MTTNRPPIVLLHPRGHCKAQPFYFRGDDVLKEPEYIIKERKDYIKKYRKTLKEAEKIKAEFEKVQEELQQKDGYTVALANALGDDSSLTTQNAQLRHELAELTTRLEGTERAITKVKEKSQAGVISALLQEKAYYNTEIKELGITIWNGMDQIREGKRGLARVVISDDFATANIAEGVLKAKRQVRNNLKSQLTALFHKVTDIQGTGILKKQAQPQLPLEIRHLVERKEALELEKEDLERQTFEEVRMAQQGALALVDQIDRMNQVLVALGGDQLDIDQLREHYSSIDMLGQKTAPNEKEDQKRNTTAEEETSELPQ